jgi:hypothetical protein
MQDYSNRRIEVWQCPRKPDMRREPGYRVWGTVDNGDPDSIGRFEAHYPKHAREEAVRQIAELFAGAPPEAKIDLHVRAQAAYVSEYRD